MRKLIRLLLVGANCLVISDVAFCAIDDQSDEEVMTDDYGDTNQGLTKKQEKLIQRAISNNEKASEALENLLSQQEQGTKKKNKKKKGKKKNKKNKKSNGEELSQRSINDTQLSADDSEQLTSKKKKKNKKRKKNKKGKNKQKKQIEMNNIQQLPPNAGPFLPATDTPPTTSDAWANVIPNKVIASNDKRLPYRISKEGSKRLRQELAAYRKLPTKS